VYGWGIVMVRGCEVVMVEAARSQSATPLLRGRVTIVPEFVALHFTITHFMTIPTSISTVILV
jgi:hypothetical protein